MLISVILSKMCHCRLTSMGMVQCPQYFMIIG